MDPEFLATFLMSYVVFLLSVTCHEAAHALAAKWGGDLTAYQAGQVTLNPIPHVQREPWGMVVIPIVSMLLPGGMLLGWGSAPFDPYWEQRYPRRAAWMALAGPAANVILAIIAAVLINTLAAAGVFSRAGQDSQMAMGGVTFLAFMFRLNIVLAFFNLLPVPPLDGNSAITLILPADVAAKFREWTRSGFLAMFGIWIAWFVAAPMLEPVLNFATRLLIRI